MRGNMSVQGCDLMIRKLGVIVVLAALLFCAGCAASPEAVERAKAADRDIESILSEPLDAADYGEERRCLGEHEYRSFRVLDEYMILFAGRRGKLWLNTLRMRCPDLRHATILRVKSFSTMGRICDMDSFQTGDWFDWPWYRRWPWRWGTHWGTGIPCTFGKFQPVTESQITAIEEALKSRSR